MNQIDQHNNNQNKVRKEMYEAMTNKDKEIKELKDIILQMKVEREMQTKRNISISNMSMVRSEIQMADKVIRKVLTNSLPNYEMISKITKEDLKTIKKSPSEISKLMKEANNSMFKKEMSMDLLCRCSNCVQNNALIKTSYNKRSYEASQVFPFNDNSGMVLRYDCTDLNMEVKNIDNHQRTVTLRRKSNSSSMVSFKFIDTKKTDIDISDVKLNMHMDVSFIVHIGDFKENVSLSSSLIVKAMRDNIQNPLNELEKNKVLMNMEKETCFDKVIEKLMPNVIMNKFKTKIDDLTEEEEMLLLTNNSTVEVFFYLDNNNKMSSKNHIDLKPFDKSIKTSLLMLSSPMMRDINFFVSDQEDYDPDFDIPDYDISDEYTEEPSEEEEVDTMLDSLSIQDKYNNKLFESFRKDHGVLIGDFDRVVFKKNNTNKGVNEMMINSLVSSKMAVNFISKTEVKIHTLVALNMSYEMFLSIGYFCRNMTILSDLCLQQDLSKIVSIMRIIPVLYLFHFYNNDTAVNVFSSYMTFLDNLKDIEDLNTKAYRRLFWMMKNRAYNIIRMEKEMNEMQLRFNYIESSPQHLSRKNSLLNKRVSEVTSKMRKMDTEITRFQPDSQTSNLRKNMPLEYKSLDIEETNKMLDQFLDMEKN